MAYKSVLRQPTLKEIATTSTGAVRRQRSSGPKGSLVYEIETGVDNSSWHLPMIVLKLHSCQSRKKSETWAGAAGFLLPADAKKVIVGLLAALKDFEEAT